MTSAQFWIYMFAIAISPLIAAQVPEFIRKQQEKRHHRFHVFRTLMTTRGTRLSNDHVQALNMIALEFHGNDRAARSVQTAWKAYINDLNNRGMSVEVWVSKGDDLFIDLLHARAISLEYDFDKTEFRNTSYVPIADGEIEDYQRRILHGLAEVLDEKKNITILLSEGSPNQPPPADAKIRRS